MSFSVHVQGLDATANDPYAPGSAWCFQRSSLSNFALILDRPSVLRCDSSAFTYPEGRVPTMEEMGLETVEEVHFLVVRTQLGKIARYFIHSSHVWEWEKLKKTLCNKFDPPQEAFASPTELQEYFKHHPDPTKQFADEIIFGKGAWDVELTYHRFINKANITTISSPDDIGGTTPLFHDVKIPSDQCVDQLQKHIGHDIPDLMSQDEAVAIIRDRHARGKAVTIECHVVERDRDKNASRYLRSRPGLDFRPSSSQFVVLDKSSYTMVTDHPFRRINNNFSYTSHMGFNTVQIALITAVF